MNVTELISLLKEIPGHLQVFSKDFGFGDMPINNLKITETISPPGIKYLLLNEEVNSPKPREQVGNEEKPTPSIIQPRNPALVADKPKRIRGIKAKMNEEETQKIINHVKEGKLNYSRIAETIGCSVSHVSRTAKKQGLKKKKKITIEKTITEINQPEPIQVDFNTEKTKGRTRKNKTGLQKDFTGWRRKCRGCKQPKPPNQIRYGYCKECRSKRL